MRTSRSLLMLFVAIISALLAVVMAVRWLNKQAGDVEAVVVASSNISMGQKLTENDLSVINWPAGKVPEGAFHDAKLLVGRTLKSSLVASEPVLNAKLAPEGVNGGLSAVIPEGKRAITVKVNEVIGVAGFALPGNFVDIIVNTKQGAYGDMRDAKSISKTVLEHIMVLAVGEEIDRDATKPKNVNVVTLEVNPEQAEKIDLARSVGELSLVLRNQSDSASGATQGVTLDQLLNVPTAQSFPEPIVQRADALPPVKYLPKVKPKAKSCTRVIVGTKDTQECF